MSDLQLDQLRTFAAVVQQGTFDSAARELNITPSAVSQRIKALEQSAGRILVQRTSPVEATGAGEVLLRLARQMALLEREALQELGLDGLPGESAPVSLVVNADSLATWFLRVFDRLTPEDGMLLEIHREDEQHSTALLRSGVVMAAVTAIPEPVQGCSAAPLGSMRYRAVAARALVERWAAAGDPLPLLVNAPVVVFDRKDDLQDRYFQSFVGEELRSQRHYVPSSAEFAAAIRAGLGWGLLPEQQCLADIAGGGLVELAPAAHLDVPLYWQRWRVSSRVLDHLSAVVAEAARAGLRPAGELTRAR